MYVIKRVRGKQTYQLSNLPTALLVQLDSRPGDHDHGGQAHQILWAFMTFVRAQGGRLNITIGNKFRI